MKPSKEIYDKLRKHHSVLLSIHTMNTEDIDANNIDPFTLESKVEEDMNEDEYGEIIRQLNENVRSIEQSDQEQIRDKVLKYASKSLILSVYGIIHSKHYENKLYEEIIMDENEIQFLREVRNGVAHGNYYNSDSESTNNGTVIWRGIEVDTENDDYGSVIPALLRYSDCVYLIYDVCKTVKKAEPELEQKLRNE